MTIELLSPIMSMSLAEDQRGMPDPVDGNSSGELNKSLSMGMSPSHMSVLSC